MKRSTNSRHLLGLINAMLEAGAVTHDVTDVAVIDAVQAAASLVGAQVEVKGLTLRVDSCARDVRMRTDADKVQQVLLDLLSNAR